MQQTLWPRGVIRKWLNRSSKSNEYTADPQDDKNSPYESDGEGINIYIITTLLFLFYFYVLRPSVQTSLEKGSEMVMGVDRWLSRVI